MSAPEPPAIVLLGSAPTSFHDYAESYRQAAGSLVDAVELGTRRSADLVYPIGFMFRHALELSLKDANIFVESVISARVESGDIDAGRLLSAAEIEQEVFRHQLEPLLDRLERRLHAVADVEWITRDTRDAVKAFSLFDGNAERFRYPEQSRGRGPSFPEGIDERWIDLRQLRVSLDSAIDFLLDGLRRDLLEVRPRQTAPDVVGGAAGPVRISGS